MESWPYPCDLRERQAGSTPSNEALGGRTHQFVDQRAQEVGVVYREGGSSHRLLARILRGDHNRGKAHQAGLDPLPLGGTTLSPTIAYWRSLLSRPVRLVANDIILLRLPHDETTRMLQGCSKHRTRLCRRALCASKYIHLCYVMTLLRAYQCPYPPFPFPTYYPDTGTGSGHSNRIYVGPFGQPLSKQTLRRLTTLHACDLARHWSQPDGPTRAHALLPHGQQALYFLILIRAPVFL